MKKGGGFGVLILLVVVAVVLWLVARAWEDMSPAARQAVGAERGGETRRADGLPDLKDMRDSTAGHAGQVQDALEAIE